MIDTVLYGMRKTKTRVFLFRLAYSTKFTHFGSSARAAQVGDITGFGDPEEAANLLLPRGAVLLGYSKEVVALRPRKSSTLGEIQVPPRTYYR